MKRIRFVFLTLVCICLLCACGNQKRVSGRVMAFENGILKVQTEKGKNYDILVDPQKTVIFGLVSGEKEGRLDSNCRVQVNWARKEGQRVAEHIWIDSRLHRNVMQLSDGTPIDVWERTGWREYCLEDGTPLLVEDNPGSLENNSRWNELLYYEEFPEAAQQGILRYYSQLGNRYDILTLLEDAYLVYTVSEEFNNHYVSQYTGIEAWNEHIICCQQNLTIPQERTNGYGDYFCEGTVFDRNTGEVISNFDLFTITPEELEAYLLDFLDSDGDLDRENIQLNLKPEQIVLCRDGSVEFYLVDRTEGDYKGMLQIGLTSEQAQDILQPWALVGLKNNS
mgnify:FL=1